MSGGGKAAWLRCIIYELMETVYRGGVLVIDRTARLVGKGEIHRQEQSLPIESRASIKSCTSKSADHTIREPLTLVHNANKV